ncbi:MAG: glycoside hydrolase family 3 C-terminal domain-containing protein [Bifidobacteriaceae bacterium]|nr:glycoside hydrolase family 3 C-terminal domain-containing protein [Bifidobacteriaceae bacterium]
MSKVEDLSVQEKALLLSGASEWDSRSNKNAQIPSFVMSDGPHGVRRQTGEGDHLGLGASKPATCFPPASTLANSWDVNLAKTVGEALGKEAHDLDVNVLLGPGINIKRDPLCGRNFEYYSEDPQLAGRIAAGFVQGVQSNGISACPKHFAVNSQELRRLASNSVVDERTMREIYLTAFEIVVKQARPWALMSAYNQVNGVYAHENAHLLTEILRKEWGYDGAVISDWGGSNSAKSAVEAGGTLEMPSPGYTSVPEIVKAVEKGEISEQALNKRVSEIETLAQRTKVEGVGREDVLSPEIIAKHHALAKEIAQQCFVLLENRDNTLPLQKGLNIAVVGDLARDTRYQGSGSSKVNATVQENILDILEKSQYLNVVGYAQGYDRQGGESAALINEATSLAVRNDCDAVVVVVGLDEQSESEGLDRSAMKLSDVQNKLMKQLVNIGKPVVAVLISGSPVEIPWADDVQALVYMGLSGQAGASALHSVLIGEVNPSGHLSESWAYRYDDCPTAGRYPAEVRDSLYKEALFVGYRYYATADIPVRYPFGYGLSYAKFTYSDIVISRETVKFTITNTSDVDGATVAQLYVHAPNGVLRPVRELKGFKKVFLKAGESQEVSIDFDEYTFRHFDVTTNTWQIQNGEWQILIGENVEDIDLQSSLTITDGVDIAENEAANSHYAKGLVKEVTDAEFQALFNGTYDNCITHEKDYFDNNDPISSWVRSKSVFTRIVAKVLIKRERTLRVRNGSPDLNTLFVLNMPPRAMVKMSQGMVDSHMVDALVRIANGHTFKGLGDLIKASVKNISARKRLAKELSQYE